ncbi:3-oxoacyl-ACP reductase [Sporosarcina koreensis]|uniref:3-oxoacyl-ACP reductase n=1 Tax=Sporosarcina koreensis TaxID=334735 RepID=UPI000590837D|nr:3-oxoacyl-ACP reductase [Sporosarcina koreensis]
MTHGEFAGKTVFITGAASGIGRAQAEAFIEQGAAVFGFDQDAEGLRQLSAEHPRTFAYRQGDVRKAADVAKAAEQALAAFGSIDILCNTAGVLDGFTKTLETDEALWDRIMETNVKGMYLTTNAILPHMIANGKGVLVNMASIAGLVGGGGGAAYTASKHAVIGYTKQVDLDYCRAGIRANAIAPGAIETPMNAADFAGAGEMAAQVADETPAGRWAQPGEVAALTLYLAGRASDYVHGAVIPIDGGWTAK